MKWSFGKITEGSMETMALTLSTKDLIAWVS